MPFVCFKWECSRASPARAAAPCLLPGPADTQRGCWGPSCTMRSCSAVQEVLPSGSVHWEEVGLLTRRSQASHKTNDKLTGMWPLQPTTESKAQALILALGWAEDGSAQVELWQEPFCVCTVSRAQCPPGSAALQLQQPTAQSAPHLFTIISSTTSLGYIWPFVRAQDALNTLLMMTQPSRHSPIPSTTQEQVH